MQPDRASSNVETHASLEEALEADKAVEEAKEPDKAPAKKTVVKKRTPKKAAVSKTMSPGEFVQELGIEGLTPRRLRVILRDKYGTHYKRWDITPQMQKELKALLEK